MLLLLFVFNLSSTAQTKSTTAKTTVTAKQTAGYNIPITLAPIKNKWIYLGCHYGKYKNLADSAFLNEQSQGIFKGKTKLPQGIYFVVSPDKTLLFEFLMDKDQNFTIKADTSKPEAVAITGSLDNQIFTQYTSFLATKTPELNKLQAALKQAKTSQDSVAIRGQLTKANKILQDYREALLKQHPTSMLAIFFETMKRPEIPAIPMVNGKADSTYPYKYVKGHFWDDVPFDNDALVRTPFFEPKVEEYFKYYVPAEADSIIPEVNYMLLLSRNSKETV